MNSSFECSGIMAPNLPEEFGLGEHEQRDIPGSFRNFATS